MSVTERIDRIRSDCRHANVAHRRYMATALAGAEPAVLGSPAGVAVLDELARDPDADVRAAVAWWSPPKRPVTE